MRGAAERRVGLHEVAPNAHLKNPRTLCSWRVMSWILGIIDVTRPLSGGRTGEKGRDVQRETELKLNLPWRRTRRPILGAA